jgi:alcohol dehydrogenase YqhD (iron-dependent ADH family)
MENFIFHNPTKIVFGKGVLSQVGAEVVKYGKRALLVYGQNSIKKNGVYNQVVDSLKKEGVEIIEFQGVKGNPVLSHANQGAQLAKTHKVDVIVAVGGGSVIDESKGIAAGTVANCDIWDFFTGKQAINNALPLITVLTLPAAGSEMNGGLVITNEQTNDKFGMGGIPALYPKASFLDPETTYTLSVQQTAYACSDIMSHLSEGYFTTTAQSLPIQEGYIEGIVKAVMGSMLKIKDNPNNYDARAHFMWGATLGWNGLGTSGVTAGTIPSHALEHPISALYDIAHGAGLSITTPAWLKFKKDSIAPRILLYGKNVLGLNTSSPDEVIAALEAFYTQIGTPTRMSQAGITNPNIEALAQLSNTLFTTWGIQNYTLNDLKTIYKLAQ